jgi:uncharacterized damage-inducible protein DinB
MTDDLRFPIGKYQVQPFSEALLQQYILDIQYLPQHIENAIANLDADQLQTPYRPDGWTVHQVVHHLADSHMNSFTRFKLALTEENPTIKPYDEVAWANLPDVMDVPINISITLLHALHNRWVVLLHNLKPADFDKKIIHPESKREMSIWFLLGLYAWHCKHHTAHITALRDRMKW